MGRAVLGIGKGQVALLAALGVGDAGEMGVELLCPFIPQPGLQQALEDLLPYVANDTGLVGYLVARAALARTESRGAHTRTDFAGQVEARHTLLSLADLPELAEREAVPA